MFRISSEALNLWQLITKLKKIEDNQVELIFSQNSPLLENFLAFKIIKHAAGKLNKEVIFRFEDSNFSYLGPLLNGSGVQITKDVKGTENIEDFGEEVVNGYGSTTPVHRFPLIFPKLRFNFKLNFFWPLIIVGLVLLILSGGISYYYFVPKTEVSLVVESEPLSRAFEVTAAATVSAGLANSVVIPAIEIAASEKKSEATSSTGKKDLGDKALGSVTLYNKTAEMVNLPSGTTLTKARVNGDDLRFLIKTNAAVPARTVNNLTVSGYDSGTVNAEVAAENFGEDYNLPAGSTFTVGSKSTNDLIADNAVPFSGGTKRQAMVVTASDQKGLLDNLSKTLRDELKTVLLTKLISGQNIDESSVVYETINKVFDRNVGEETSNLVLTLEMRATALAFSQSDLKNAVYAKLLSYVPDGYQLFGNAPEVETLETKSVGKVLKILARGKGFIVPKIDPDGVKRKILGKTLTFSDAYLKSLPGLSSYKIINPLNFGSLSFLPFRAQSLKVEVVRR